MMHEVVAVERQQRAGRVRVSAYVVVSERPSRDELEHLAQDLATEFRDDEGYAVLWLGFYDRRQHVDNRDSAPLGHWMDAPHGRWGTSIGSDAGDYSRYKASSYLRDKDWPRQPSDRDVELWTRWKGLGDQLHATVDPHDSDTDPDAIAEALVEIEDSLDPDELKAALRRVAFWTST